MHLPINRKKIYIDSFVGRGYGCNPKYIAEALHTEDASLKFIWHTDRNRKTAPSWIKEVSSEYSRIYHLCTSKIWIDNSRKSTFVRKRRGQYYVQTWHGMLCLKQIEKDVEDKLPDWYIESCKHDSQMIDLFLSNSKFTTELFQRVMWYDGEIMLSGTPRFDFVVNNPKGNGSVHKYYNLNPETKLVLYAPTFRADDKYRYSIDLDRALDAFRRRFGGDVRILVRLHPNLRDKKIPFRFSNDILDATDYPDMYELLAECDYMINDYSSSMFEFAYMRKPVFLFVDDLEDYKRDRNLYFDIESLPFPASRTDFELEQSISRFDDQEYRDNVEDFYKENSVVETGHASYDVACRILAEINKKNG